MEPATGEEASIVQKWWKSVAAAGVIMAVLTLAGGCGQAPAANTSGGTDATASETSGVQSGKVAISISGMRYHPDHLTVKVGTTVTWTNNDNMAHDVASGAVENGQVKTDGTFKSSMLNPGDTWSHTFNTPGTYPYLCTVPGHAQSGMVATITVEK